MRLMILLVLLLPAILVDAINYQNSLRKEPNYSPYSSSSSSDSDDTDSDGSSYLSSSSSSTEEYDGDSSGGSSGDSTDSDRTPGSGERVTTSKANPTTQAITTPVPTAPSSTTAPAATTQAGTTPGPSSTAAPALTTSIAKEQSTTTASIVKGLQQVAFTPAAIPIGSANPASKLFEVPVQSQGGGTTINAILNGRYTSHMLNHRPYFQQRISKGGFRPSVAKVLPSIQALDNSTSTVSGSAVSSAAAAVTNLQVFQADYYDLEWLGYSTIGSPPQQFLVLYDTGSANFWVADSSCKGKSQCPAIDYFTSSASTSYLKNGTKWAITYGSGSASGFYGEDTVGIGPQSSQLSIPKTTFGQSTSFSPLSSTAKYDGIFGLGFQALAVSDTLPPFQNAVNQGLVASLFSVYLATADNNIITNPSGGVFTFGGVDTTHCGTVTWVPLSLKLWWVIPVTRVAVGSTVISSSSVNVISDTGTSLMLTSSSTAASVAKAVGATFSNKYGIYLIGCSASYSAMTMTIGGASFTLTSKVLTLDVGLTQKLSNGQRACYFGVAPTDLSFLGSPTPISWIFGDPFIRAVCNIYDVGNNRLGLAAATTSAG